MKKLVFLMIGMMISTSVFAAGSFFCISRSKLPVMITGIISQGVLLPKVTVSYGEKFRYQKSVQLDMNWIDLDKNEIRALAHDIENSVTRLKLVVNNGVGNLSYSFEEDDLALKFKDNVVDCTIDR